MKTKLREYFDDRIIITTINGKSNVVAMRRTTESILFEFRNNHIEDQSSEKNRIIEAVSKFTLEDIKAVDTFYDINCIHRQVSLKQKHVSIICHIV